MIEYRPAANILDDPCIVVIPVNTVGVMGAGLAKQAEERYPLAERAYRSALRLDCLEIGQVFPVYLPEKSLLLLPTKKHWRNPSELEYVKQGLMSLTRFMKREPFKRIAIPKLGCGLGGLAWADVHEQISYAARILQKRNVDVAIYGERP